MIAAVLLNVLATAAFATEAPLLAAGNGPGAEGAPQSGSIRPVASASLAAVLTETDALLLAGAASFPDLDRRLAGLAPADRLLAVAYLRRAGLLSGPMLPLDSLLAPGTDKVTHE